LPHGKANIQELTLNCRLNSAVIHFPHQDQHKRNLNRLEALLNRHWPEVVRILDLKRVSLSRKLFNVRSLGMVR